MKQSVIHNSHHRLRRVQACTLKDPALYHPRSKIGQFPRSWARSGLATLIVLK